LIIEGTVNLGMIICKLIVGSLTGSAAIIADALHSFTDLINNFVAFLAIRMTQKPADDDHQYGHQKFEQLAVFFLATLLCVVAIEVVISALSRSGEVVAQNKVGLIVLVMATIVNVLLSMWQQKWAIRLESELLRADASHTFSDALTSIVAIAGWQLAASGLFWVDTVFACIVAIFIGVLAYRLFSRAIPILSDSNNFNNTKVKQSIENLPQVILVRQLRVRSINNQHFADLTVALDSRLSLLESHKIADKIEILLNQKFDINDVTVHIEPA
jgi:cation diffusion facilitator family transporter